MSSPLTYPVFGVRHLGAFLLVPFFFVTFIFSLFFPHKTEAGLFVPVYDQPASVQRAAQITLAGGQLAATQSLTLKEIALDMVVFALINTFIDKLGDQMVNWIEGGFKGGPGFIEDPAGFMLDVGDQVTGKFIADLGLEHFLCDPLMLPSLQLALGLNFGVGYGRAQKEYYCTVGRAFEIQKGAVEGWLNGDFSGKGGWNMWANVAVHNQNVIGGGIAAGIELDKRIAAALGMEQSKLDWGSGFLSQTNIDGYIKTPGKVIENSINDTFDSSRRRIEVADEISEIVGALIATTMKKLTTGLKSDGSAIGYSFDITNINNAVTSGNLEDVRNAGFILSTDPASQTPLPTFVGIPGSTRVYAVRALQGPATRERSGCNGSCDASYAIDNRKSGAKPFAQVINNVNFAWFEAELETGLPINFLSIYNPTGEDEGASLKPQTSIKLLDSNRVDVTAQFTCSMKFVDSSGVSRTNNTCAFQTVAGGYNRTKYYDVTLTPVVIDTYPQVRYVRLEQRNNSDYLTLDEIEFFKRINPTFDPVQSLSIGSSDPLNPYQGISAKDADGTVIPNNIIASSLPTINKITYQTRAPDGVMKEFNASIPGNWTFLYTATDKYGIRSDTIERIITVASSASGVTPLEPPVILAGAMIASGEVGPVTISQGSSFNVFETITARDARGGVFTNLTIPEVRATYARRAPGNASHTYEANFDSSLLGEWIIRYSFTDLYNIPASNNAFRTVTVTAL